MRKKVFIRAAIGFALGMAAFLLICLLFNRSPEGTVSFVGDSLLARVGSKAAALLLQLAVCGLYGAGCMAGTVFYEIEQWPIALGTLLHYAVVALGYLFPALLLSWELSAGMLLIIEAIMTAGFFVIWLIIYLSYKTQVRELNKLLQKKNGSAQKGSNE